jgi:hypothetical protein
MSDGKDDSFDLSGLAAAMDGSLRCVHPSISLTLRVVTVAGVWCLIGLPWF